MLPHVVFALILLLAGAVASAAPAARTGEAAVRETSSGLPCFTITEREEKRGTPNFQAVAVYDISARPKVKMWVMSMPPDRTFPVLFSMCVPYGGRVQSLPQTVSTTLQQGKLYEVSIDVRPGGTPGLPRSYAARFCLAKQRDGSVALRHSCA
jgi:hypothetical protein